MKLLQGLQKEKNELVIIILRFAIGSVFLWFGISKWINPDNWFGYIYALPPFMLKAMPVSVTVFLYANGAFEFLVGLLLVGGQLLRPAAAAAGLFLLSIMIFLGADELAVRDMALVGCCLALFVHANAGAKKQIPLKWIATITACYVFLLFIVGVLYLKKLG